MVKVKLKELHEGYQLVKKIENKYFLGRLESSNEAGSPLLFSKSFFLDFLLQSDKIISKWKFLVYHAVDLQEKDAVEWLDAAVVMLDAAVVMLDATVVDVCQIVCLNNAVVVFDVEQLDKVDVDIRLTAVAGAVGDVDVDFGVQITDADTEFK